MNKKILRLISLILIITFVTTQISPAYAYENLGASLLGDNSLNPDRTRDGRNDIGHQLEPGAIGNGQPLIDLVQGKLPKKIEITDTFEIFFHNKE